MAVRLHDLFDPGFSARFVPVVYLGTVVIFLDQLSDLAGALRVLQPGTPAWRFQLAAVTTTRMPAMVVATLASLAMAVWAQRPGARRACLAILWLLAGLLVAAIGTFWLDGQTLKAMVQGADPGAFVRRWVRTMAVAGLGPALFGLVAVLAWRGRKADSGLKAPPAE